MDCDSPPGSAASDDSFEYQFETDSDEERERAMAGPVRLTLEAVLAEQKRSRQQKAGGAPPRPADSAPTGATAWTPVVRGACVYCRSEYCRQIRRHSESVVLDAIARQREEVPINHFGYRVIALQRLALAKLLNVRLAADVPDGVVHIEPYLVRTVSDALGCESLFSRAREEFASNRSCFRRWLSCGGYHDRDLHAKCLVLAVRLEQLVLCKRLLRLQLSVDVCQSISPRLNAGMGSVASALEWDRSELHGTSLLDITCRGPAPFAYQVLHYMWDVCPPQHHWAAVAWWRTIMRMSGAFRCAALSQSLAGAQLAERITWLDSVTRHLEHHFPEFDCKFLKAQQVETLLSQAGEQQCRDTEVHPTILVWWTAQPGDVFCNVCPFLTLCGRCPMNHGMHLCPWVNSHHAAQNCYSPGCKRDQCVHCRVAAMSPTAKLQQMESLAAESGPRMWCRGMQGLRRVEAE